MPSASTMEMPFRLSSGSSGIRTPWKSWLVSLAPLSENCPTDIFSSRGIPAFATTDLSPYEERPVRIAKSSGNARGRRTRRSLSRHIARGARPDMGRVQRQPREGEAADEVTHHGRDLVPEDVVEPGELAAEHEPGREQEHVHDGMLEGHEEEQHDRHPHRDHLAADMGGDHGADDARRDHPVA